MSAPLTIVICARDAEETIARAVASACAQGDFPVLLVDDFSSDATVERAREAGGTQLEVARPDRHAGLGAARQFALDDLRTPFGMWLDADDELLPGRADRLLARLLDEGADLAFDAAEMADGATGQVRRILPLPSFLQRPGGHVRLFERQYLPGPAWPAFRLETARRVGYDVDQRHAEDTDFLLRALCRGARLTFERTPGYRMYTYDSSLSRQREKQAYFVARLLRKHTYTEVRRLYRNAAWSPAVTAWGLASMALFRQEIDPAGRFLAEFREAVNNPGRRLEKSGPELLPAGWQAGFLGGNLAALRGNAAQACTCYDEAASWATAPEERNNRGLALAALGDGDEARTCFDEALRLYPDYADARANRDAVAPDRLTRLPLRRLASRDDYVAEPTGTPAISTPVCLSA